jgi:hypothetical protein
MSPELRLMFAPRDTYASLARLPRRVTLLTAVRRPLLVAMVLGTVAAISATGHVTPRLLLSTTLCWCFVIALQAAIALVLIAGPAHRTVGLARAIDLFFAGHAPWSLWMLGVAAWAPWSFGHTLMPVGVAALVPIALTLRIVSAFFREVLEMDPREAVARTVAQQAMTWGLFLLLAGTAVQLIPRILTWFA